MIAVKAMRGWRMFRKPPRHRFVLNHGFEMTQLFVLLFVGGHMLACLWFVIAYEAGTLERHKEHWSSLHEEGVSSAKL